MFDRTFHATHPAMMQGVDNETLRERYIVQGLFAADTISLNYSHNERLVIGSAAPVNKGLKLPDQEEPAKGAPSCPRHLSAQVIR